ncbi:hypothetical protein DM02DRAFT_568519 [Periconia macrospinosa]|uniref:Mis12-domain-containing protein n=1 Tax=Periconia macrospinosa TaxID=97972 RepID=A0A2V1DG13_9PLEO|nr:hypothetical protein DM02DRAFT_568519 [Periconia macrospinosa]
MANAKQQENLLLTEHFSWPPISLLDDIINAVNEVLYRCTDTFETGLLSADPSLLGFDSLYASRSPPTVPEVDEDGNNIYPEAKLEIEEGTLKLETLMENAVDRNFDRLEIWCLRNVLCLPKDEGMADWVRLGGYENLRIPSKDNNLTPEVLYSLRRKLVETKKLNVALVAEQKRNEAQIARLRALLQPATTVPKTESRSSTSPTKSSPQNGGTTASQTPAPFAFLTHSQPSKDLGIKPLPITSSTTTTTTDTSTAPESLNPLSTHTTFTTSQLPYLRQLLASLRPHIPATALPSNTTSEKHEWAKERRVYVESQSKRALERRGVDTKDGVEGVVEGARLRGEEVRGLEGIVEALGGRKRPAAAKEEGTRMDDDVDVDGERGGDTRAGAEGDDEMDVS